MIENLIRKLLRKPPLTEHEIAARHIRNLPTKDLRLFELHFLMLSMASTEKRIKGITAGEMSELIHAEVERRQAVQS
jgi:hypothetical protein